MIPRLLIKKIGGYDPDFKVCFDYDLNLVLSLKDDYIALNKIYLLPRINFDTILFVVLVYG